MRVLLTVSVIILAMTASLFLPACGDSGPSAETTSCSVERSELGPFSSETALGRSVTEDEARARMAQDDIVAWIAVSAVGPWDRAWEQATAELGTGIHVDLSWLDVNGEIVGLYEPGDVYPFSDLRVSRSFQGKIEHNGDPLYLPIQNNGRQANFDAGCRVTAVDVGDPSDDALLDVTALVATRQ